MPSGAEASRVGMRSQPGQRNERDASAALGMTANILVLVRIAPKMLWGCMCQNGCNALILKMS